ncbi:MAG: FtsW/RodA/SpoVE family cell cycle protein [bacterium]
MALIILFLVYNILSNRLDSNDIKLNRYSNKQRLIIVFSHILGFIIIYLKIDKINVIYLLCEQFILFVFLFFFYNRLYKNASKILINNCMYLLSIGFITLTRLSYDTGLKQFRWSVISIIISLTIPIIIVRCKFLSKFIWTYALLGFLLLITVFFYGEKIYGARNWVVIGNFSFQPSEIVKIFYILLIASILKNNKSLKRVIISSFVTLTYITVLIFQKDLGMALIFFVIYMGILFVATSKWIYFLGGLLSASIASSIAYKFFNHVRVRVEAWKNPWNDVPNKGYQIAHSLFAIGTGSWFGLGLGNGIPEKIPVVKTDFIYSAIIEEWGILFGIGLILIMLYIALKGFNIAKALENNFYVLIGVGISCAYAFQVFLIIGGVTKVIPVTGVTLPFVSYGGSSLLSSFLMISILQGIYILSKQVKTPK